MSLGESITLAELEADPYPALARLRAHEPVSFVPDLGHVARDAMGRRRVRQRSPRPVHERDRAELAQHGARAQHARHRWRGASAAEGRPSADILTFGGRRVDAHASAIALRRAARPIRPSRYRRDDGLRRTDRCDRPPGCARVGERIVVADRSMDPRCLHRAGQLHKRPGLGGYWSTRQRRVGRIDSRVSGPAACLRPGSRRTRSSTTFACACPVASTNHAMASH